MSDDVFLTIIWQARQNQELKERADRLSRLKEVTIGQHIERDVETALAKIKEVLTTTDIVNDRRIYSILPGGTRFLQKSRIRPLETAYTLPTISLQGQVVWDDMVGSLLCKEVLTLGWTSRRIEKKTLGKSMTYMVAF